ncbi:hypothetical protein TthAA37_11200 [Thermus thermophilus]|uniref:Uncharacterized protein n=1 Tax=Thermus thermophilus TaxID=274 RepID=A0AAD1KUJ1_THETH|nr:hypothetical protein [Thermus thermophilus]BBL82264.1 hypothetical protein TthAA220_10480 [Thermus thermophilus]BBL84566.1 hypothetical protein TthAA229_10470 [Thermus thermophilus]BCZ86922.1 hypothetical protein TthAA11_11040 [Thermus thermophilus]BCZ89296.1 hypothetical protein TthAA22_11010 [Thermus thermophilus]BCZ91931.1 hypothetical protein TthAA37_11200 [Thermus thermophilus]
MRLLRLAKELGKLAKDNSGRVVIWAVYDGDEPPDPATRRRVVEGARARNPRTRHLVIYWPEEGEG